MANWRLNQKTPTEQDRPQTPPDPLPAIRAELHEVAEVQRDLNDRSDTAREKQYRLIRQMLAEGATWDQTQFAAETSRPTVMRAVRDGKRREAEAAEAQEIQHDAERDAFHRAMDEDPGLTPRP